jgi:hypothetical protein
MIKTSSDIRGLFATPDTVGRIAQSFQEKSAVWLLEKDLN